METLHPGEQRPEVAKLQDNLYLLRYEVYATGVYDENTVGAVHAFRVSSWGDPGDDDCEQYTYDAIELAAQELHAESPAPPDPHGGAGQGGADHGAAPGQSKVVHHDGTVVTTGTARQVQRQGDHTPNDDMGAVYEIVRATNPAIAATIDHLQAQLLEFAHSIGDVTVAIGVDADIAFLYGITAGGGLYASTTGESGFYKSFGVDIGIVAQLAVGGALTIIRGGPDKFGGPCFAIEIGGDIGVGASGALLFSLSDGSYLGFCAEVTLGIGGGLYASFSNTWLTAAETPVGSAP